MSRQVVTYSIKSNTVINLLNESDLVLTKLDSSATPFLISELQNKDIGNKQFDLMFYNDEIDSEAQFEQYFSEGLRFYITNKSIPHPDHAVEGLVNNIENAISLICSEFYNHPETHLKTVGFIGDNLDDTASIMAQTILNSTSSKENTSFKQYNTIDLFSIYKEMSQVVQRGLEYFVFDNKVVPNLFVLNYLVIFSMGESNRNFSYEDSDTFYKERVKILNFAEKIIIHKDIKRFEDIFRRAKNSERTKHILVFGSNRIETVNHCDIMFETKEVEESEYLIVKSATKKGQMLHIDGNYSLSLNLINNVPIATGIIVLSGLCAIDRHIITDCIEFYQ